MGGKDIQPFATSPKQRRMFIAADPTPPSSTVGTARWRPMLLPNEWVSNHEIRSVGHLTTGQFWVGRTAQRADLATRRKEDSGRDPSPLPCSDISLTTVSWFPICKSSCASFTGIALES